MFFYRFNRGPRGRMFGHRGSPVGMILAIFGLISLAVLVGILIGLLLYRSIHAWKAAAREEKEESAPAAKKTDEKKAEEKEEEYYPTDTYRSYGA